MRVTFFLLVTLILFGCSTNSKLTEEQVKAEKEAMWSTVSDLFKAIAEENWENFSKNITDDCILYGTDVAEVDHGSQELEIHMKKTFDMVENSEIIDFKNKDVKLSPTLGTVMVDATWNTIFLGQEASMPLRSAFTLEKVDGNWLISQGLFSIPSVGQAAE
ncbi:nuclear transport factor 2 family protein [candidate division KSB1 bacterium]|nr:nuclear transport factor 2 family protein [candidate division KSB1 bacterium]